jgi:hypothetical protein
VTGETAPLDGFKLQTSRENDLARGIGEMETGLSLIQDNGFYFHQRGHSKLSVPDSLWSASLMETALEDSDVVQPYKQRTNQY